MGLAFSRKKLVAQEKKQKKEQRDEAEKHLQMQRELVRGHASMCTAQSNSTRLSSHGAVLPACA